MAPRPVPARLAERRRRQDQLIGAVTDALAARDAALAALEKAKAALEGAIDALNDRGIARHELAILVGVPVGELGGESPGRRGRDRSVAQRAEPADTTAGTASRAEPDGEGGAVRLWLAMIERGSSPKTHGLDGDGWLLCRGTGDPGHLTSWVGYAFDVDCHRCAKLLADQLTEDEFG